MSAGFNLNSDARRARKQHSNGMTAQPTYPPNLSYIDVRLSTGNPDRGIRWTPT